MFNHACSVQPAFIYLYGAARDREPCYSTFTKYQVTVVCCVICVKMTITSHHITQLPLWL